VRLSVSKYRNLDEAVEAMKAEIDKAAGIARNKYITFGPGQAETYLSKSENAKAYIASGCPENLTDYPWVEADAEAYELTPAEAAAHIISSKNAWSTLGVAIEKVRLGYKHRITKATTSAQVISLANEAIEKLEQI
jgi:hypothetical protein